ncbi:hypothetical protein GCM10017668_05190 [Streptomyces tuirus]|uniref:ABC transporter domain-containing protein n=1 Tax=Streptomyces tuirus TaxID=68278 RepID=A0A7G1NA86_9ACTN|nr:hypothetical protein GCM10017668_05190 [Streptomyces tuirus]
MPGEAGRRCFAPGPDRTRARGPAVEALRLVKVTKTYGGGDSVVTALNGVTLSLERGTFTAVMGPSGSGTSTLLSCAAGLDRTRSPRPRAWSAATAPCWCSSRSPRP